ncbi:MAG: response regulator transcription factor [Bacteroidaceae bacterium]|nr:response regulator transcription factor [Bacteroidaceae bacterium]MBQ3238559.1 response regulator transcription factor [Bacteroidaceae bacterium]MBQ7966775.1 response regulator transcription factor [Bacteroidaceae bacterium]MBR4041483.1 response regulator transcription factor [Bacteroidaceae bacterium]
MKILIIEDDLSFQEILRRTLEQERYIVEVAPNYRTGLIKLSDYTYDCILLDINLPDGNGLNLLRELKEMKKTSSLIIISARDSIEDKVEGLDLGADDYLAKPFHLAELLSRIKSVIRRNNHGGEQYVSYGNVKVNPHTFDIWVGDTKQELSRKEFDLLLYFMQRPSRLVSKSMLAEAIWGDHFDDVDNYDFIYAQIKNLRKRLTAWNASIEIASVYGMGYKLIEN